MMKRRPRVVARATMARDVAVAAFTVFLLLTCVTSRGAAQDGAALLPDTTAARLTDTWNRETTTRFTGDARIGAGTTLRGDVALLAGTLTVDGVVDGDVVVINGSLVISATGRITGSATVAGGEVRNAGSVSGRTTFYREPLRYRESDGRLFAADPDEPGISAGRDFAFGRTDLLIASRGAYNRVEGLPVMVGPRVRVGGTHPLTASALLIARTALASGLETHRLGWDVTLEQLLLPEQGVSGGIRLFSEFSPIETSGLSDREASLAAFLLHHDFRDHYEREGWSAFVHLARPGSPLDIEIEYRDEEHVTAPAADPPSLIRNSEPWRPQPSIAEGALRSIQLRAAYDTRNDIEDPSTGWFIRTQLEQGLGGSLLNRAALDTGTVRLLEQPGRTRFSVATLDLRRYARLSPYARLSLRVHGAVTLDGRPLPPQRQHALGGEGSLPGYRRFEFDCGAREFTVELDGETYFPWYGCDQLAFVQLEYQAGFPFARKLAESLGLSSSVGNLVRWAAFFDAGRAWNEPGARAGRSRGSDDFSADAGVGLRVGPLGLYWAMPLSGQGQGFNFFIRIGPRI